MSIFVKNIFIEREKIKKLVPLDVTQIANGEVRVFLWHHTFGREQLTTLAHELSPTIDMDDIAALRDKRFIEKLSIRLLLKLLLPQATIKYLETGRPYLTSPDIEISISHTKRVYAISFSHDRHGMDVEQYSKTALKVRSMFVNDNELPWLRQREFPLGKIGKYTMLWSAKEAIYKYVDSPGLSFKKDIVTTYEESTSQLLVQLPKQQSQCVVDVIPYPEFVLNVAKRVDKMPKIKQIDNSLELPF